MYNYDFLKTLMKNKRSPNTSHTLFLYYVRPTISYFFSLDIGYVIIQVVFQKPLNIQEVFVVEFR